MASALLIYFLTFFGAALLWPTVRLWRRDRVNALVLPYDDSAHGVVGRCFRATLLAVPLVLVARVLGLSERHLGPLVWLEHSLVQTAAWIVLGMALVWVVIAQAQMGRSWRIGIDAEAQPPLVRSGLFSWCRNPIFLGMRLSLAGMFLVMPNAVTLAIALVGEVLMQVQVRLEEEHLSRVLGEEYRAYRREVPRWL